MRRHEMYHHRVQAAEDLDLAPEWGLQGVRVLFVPVGGLAAPSLDEESVRAALLDRSNAAALWYTCQVLDT